MGYAQARRSIREARQAVFLRSSYVYGRSGDEYVVSLVLHVPQLQHLWDVLCSHGDRGLLLAVPTAACQRQYILCPEPSDLRHQAPVDADPLFRVATPEMR